MNKLFLIFGIFGTVLLLSLTNPEIKRQSRGVEHTVAYFKENAKVFAESSLTLQEKISSLDEKNPQTIVAAKQALKDCRVAYKKIEFFLNYFMASTSVIYNAPPNFEVEVPYMEAREPMGLQVIEGILFDENPADQKKELGNQIYLICASAVDLNSLLFSIQINDQQVLESVRLGIIGVITLGITGFDAPELKTGINEAAQSLSGYQIVLEPYLEKSNPYSDSVSNYLNKSIKFLNNHPDFDSFDRLSFLTDCALPLQYNLGQLIKKSDLYLNTTLINYNSKNLFFPDAIQINQQLRLDKEIVNLGENLFFEKSLSGNNTRNCASCHNPELYFTDQIPKSIALDGISTVSRNAPTLLYSALQHSQFLDGRAKSLEEQIKVVLQNPIEMNANLDTIIKRLKANKLYSSEFKKAFPNSGDSSLTVNHLTLSLASYLKTLSPFNSKFDQYIQGNKSALTNQQIRGFNLFMGKAQCGTCHFAPVFNGTVPPLYDRTDLEILGTTKGIDFLKPELDSDSGRYITYPIIYFKSAFKTPTVRNAAKTGPYMHNGNFQSLESVLEFYNKGGGAGLGLNIPLQTLSAKPLGLSEIEIKDIIEFMNALTDAKPKFSKN